MNKFSDIFTQENIAFALSIFASIGTIGTWTCSFFKSRKRLYSELNAYRTNPHGLLVHMQFSNKSTMPLSINEISILIDGNEYTACKIPQKVKEESTRVGNIIRSQHDYFSMDFPINLPPLCGDSGYLYFSSEKEIFPPLSNRVNLIIRTNRGRAIQQTFELKNLLN